MEQLHLIVWLKLLLSLNFKRIIIIVRLSERKYPLLATDIPSHLLDQLQFFEWPQSLERMWEWTLNSTIANIFSILSTTLRAYLQYIWSQINDQRLSDQFLTNKCGEFENNDLISLTESFGMIFKQQEQN